MYHGFFRALKNGLEQWCSLLELDQLGLAEPLAVAINGGLVGAAGGERIGIFNLGKFLFFIDSRGFVFRSEVKVQVGSLTLFLTSLRNTKFLPFKKHFLVDIQKHHGHAQKLTP